MKSVITLCAYFLLVNESVARKKIVGGTDAVEKYWPFIVSLRYNDTVDGESHVCAGSLISIHWVLTVAHCFKRRNILPEWHAELGRYRQDGPDKGLQRIAVESIIMHVNYSRSTSANDIALVELATPATLTEYVATVEVIGSYDEGSSLADGTCCVVAG